MDTQKYKGTNTMLTGRRKMAHLTRIEDIGTHEINRKSETADTAAKSAKRESTPALDPFYAARLLSILESIQDREEWNAMIRAIKLEGDEAKKEWAQSFEEYTILPSRGLLWTLQVSFETLLGDRALAARIGALEQRWGAALTERPGGR